MKIVTWKTTTRPEVSFRAYLILADGETVAYKGRCYGASRAEAKADAARLYGWRPADYHVE